MDNDAPGSKKKSTIGIYMTTNHTSYGGMCGKRDPETAAVAHHSTLLCPSLELHA